MQLFETFLYSGQQAKSLLFQNTSLAAPGALANRLQRRNARKANKANLNPQIKNPRSLPYSNMGDLINFR